MRELLLLFLLIVFDIRNNVGINIVLKAFDQKAVENWNRLNIITYLIFVACKFFCNDDNANSIWIVFN